MTETELTARVQCIRGDDYSSELSPTHGLGLVLPETYQKETHDTLVWTGRTERGVRVVYKMYRRRGLLTWWKEHLTRSRARREFDRALILHEAGVPCCEPLVCAAGVDPAHGRFWVIGTREIPAPRKLAHFLKEASERGARPDLSALFRTIRSMHAAGVWHGTLTPNNIVVSEPPGEAPSFHVVDLPRAVDFPYDVAPARMGWYDLLHFVHRTSAFVDQAVCVDVLEQYDFPVAKQDAFRRHLARYRPSKSLRYRLRNEFELTARWDRLLGRTAARPYIST